MDNMDEIRIDKDKLRPYSEPIISTKIDSAVKIDSVVDVHIDITNVKQFIFTSGDIQYVLDIDKLLELEILKETRKG